MTVSRETLYPVESAGVDYLTVTARSETHRLGLGDCAAQIVMLEGGNDDVPSVWLWKSYVGFQYRGLSYGERPDSCILRLSGEWAHKYGAVAYRWSENVSRLDCAATVETVLDRPDLASYGFMELKNAPRVAGRPQRFQIITNHPTGGTLQVGSRQSESYGRLYDKASESGEGEARTRWRYEVEYKGAYAKSIARVVFDNPCPRTIVRAVVRQWFSQRGVPALFSAEGFTDNSERRKVSTDEKRLLWLRKNVAGVVADLRRRGKGRQAMEALGLVSRETLNPQIDRDSSVESQED